MSIPEITTFILTTAYAEEVLASDADWETKYEIVFKFVKPKIRATGIRVEWSDPDTSYEEDVTAYVSALRDKAAQLKKLPEINLP